MGIEYAFGAFACAGGSIGISCRLIAGHLIVN